MPKKNGMWKQEAFFSKPPNWVERMASSLKDGRGAVGGGGGGGRESRRKVATQCQADGHSRYSPGKPNGKTFRIVLF